jgi:hypothetical protein
MRKRGLRSLRNRPSSSRPRNLPQPRVRQWRRSTFEQLELRQMLAWDVAHALAASPLGLEAGAKFGYSVATDGTYTVIGAPFADMPGAADAGKAFVYDNSTGALLATILNPSPSAGDEFGSAVAIEGTRVAIGAYRDDTQGADAGAVYLIDISIEPLVHTYFAPGANPNDQFGYSVDLNPNNVVVGARLAGVGGEAYLFSQLTFELVATIANPAAANGDFFGASVGLTRNGSSFVVVGAPNNDATGSNSGAAYIFYGDTGPGTAGTLVATLANPTPAAGDFFGESVDIDSGSAVVGAYGHDGTFTDEGAAYVFQLSGALDFTLANPTPGDTDQFGRDVAIANLRVVVGEYAEGATDAGLVHMFSSSTGALLQTFSNPAAAAADWFGWSVAVATIPGAPGIPPIDYMVAGVPQDDDGGTDVGRAYIFRRGNEAPTGLHLSSNSFDENFGGVVVGAFLVDDLDATTYGDQFTYTLVSGFGAEDNSLFGISLDTLSANVSADYETKTSYNIRVRATDVAGAYVEQTFVIDVRPQNDNAPFFDSPIGVNVPQGLAYDEFYFAHATDADLPAQTVTYSLDSMDADAAWFILNPVTGGLKFRPEVTYAGAVDENHDNSFVFDIIGSDGAGLTTNFNVGMNLLAPPTLDFQFAYQTVDEDDGMVEVRLVLSGPAIGDVYIPLTISGTAGATDYAIVGGVDGSNRAYIASGGTTATVLIAVLDDSEEEGNLAPETVVLTAGTSGGYLLGMTASHELSIIDNDVAPTVSFTKASQVGPEGATVVLTAILSSPYNQTITVPVQFSGGAIRDTGMGPFDYSVLSGSPEFVFVPGQRQATLTLTIDNETTPEAAELIIATLQASMGATLATSAAQPITQIVTIPQNDAPTVRFVSSYRVVPDSGGSYPVVVELSTPWHEDIVVPFTVLGTADSGDYSLPAVHSFTIPANTLTKQILVGIANDTASQGGQVRTLELRLSGPTAAVLGSARSSIIAIKDDEIPQIEFHASTVSVFENAATVTYTVKTSILSDVPIQVPITVSGTGKAQMGYAVRGSSKDFNLTTDTTTTIFATIPAHASSITRVITLYDDTATEPSEKILLTLQEPPGVAILGKKSKETITILDNDPTVTIAGSVDKTSENGATRTFVVSLSAATNVPVVVPLTWSGTAKRSTNATSGDYMATATSVTIPAGQLSATVSIKARNDSIDEPNETIKLTISEPAGPARLGRTTSDTITIVDGDNARVVWGTKNQSRSEADGRTMTFVVKLVNAADEPVTSLVPVVVDLDLSYAANVNRDNELPFSIRGFRIVQEPWDFGVRGLETNGLITIPAGSSQATFKVQLYDDHIYESDPTETVLFKIAKVTGAKAPTGSGASRTVTILDNEGPPQPKPKPVATAVASSPIDALRPPGSLAIDMNVTVYESYDEIPTVSLGTDDSYSYEARPVSPGSSGNVAYTPFTLAITLDGGNAAGLFSGATVFFDANLNGVADFLDSNGNGVLDEDELVEPTAVTGLDGAFSLTVSPDFDVNADNILSPTEGRLVSIGGTDTSTGLVSTTALTAPFAVPMITPLSTLVETLMRVEGMPLDEATQRVADAFDLDPSYSAANPVSGAAGDDGIATAAERASVKVSSAVLQIAKLYAGMTGGPPLAFFVEAAYAEIADRIAAPDSELDLSVAPVVADVISGVGVRTGIELDIVNDMDQLLDQDVIDGAATIIAAGNAKMDSLDNTGDVTFLTSLFKIKKVMQLQAAEELFAVVNSSSSYGNIGAVVVAFTGAELDMKISGATLAQFIPPAITISHGKATEGAGGQQVIEFFVDLIGESTGTVTVDYETLDVTATEDVDYSPILGALSGAMTTQTLTWGPTVDGVNETKSILVYVNGDGTFEVDETFAMMLSNATNAVIRDGVGYGFILNDDALDETPIAPGQTVLHTVAVSDGGVSLSLDEQQTLAGELAAALNATIRGTDLLSDTFRLDLSANAFRADQLTFIGGNGAGVDTVEVLGGSFASITHTLANATDGVTTFQPSGGAASVHLAWQGMEPFVLGVDAVDEIIFELPADSDAILENAGSSHPGMLQLRSPSGEFETTTFTIPNVRIVIRRDAASTVTVDNLDPAFTGVVQQVVLGAPEVVSVRISSTAWAPSFTGFVDPAGPGDPQLGFPVSGTTAPLPWQNLNQIHITFSEDVRVADGLGERSLAASDISIIGVSNAVYSASGFVYDNVSHTATITLSSSIAVDKLLVHIAGGVLQDAGASVDTQTEPFSLRFDVLPGDVNGDRSVLGSDVTQVRVRQFEEIGVAGTPTGNYSIFHDVTGSGEISGGDVTAARSRAFNELPAGEPVPPMLLVAPLTAAQSIEGAEPDTTLAEDLGLKLGSDWFITSASLAAAGAPAYRPLMRSPIVREALAPRDAALSQLGVSGAQSSSAGNPTAKDDEVSQPNDPDDVQTAAVDAALGDIWAA